LTQAQISTNTTGVNKTGRDVGKRLFESGTYKDPRLLYDVNIIFNSYLKSENDFCFRDQKKMRKRNNLLKRPCDTSHLL
jgi:hypothetical protein